MKSNLNVPLEMPLISKWEHLPTDYANTNKDQK